MKEKYLILILILINLLFLGNNKDFNEANASEEDDFQCPLIEEFDEIFLKNLEEENLLAIEEEREEDIIDLDLLEEIRAQIFEGEYINEMKKDYDKEQYKYFRIVTEYQIRKCTKDRFIEKVGEDYRSLFSSNDQSTTLVFDEDDTIWEVMNKNYALQELNTVINTEAQKEIGYFIKTDLVNNTIYNQFLEGLEEMKDLTHQIDTEMQKNQKSEQANNNKVPKMQM